MVLTRPGTGAMRRHRLSAGSNAALSPGAAFPSVPPISSSSWPVHATTGPWRLPSGEAASTDQWPCTRSAAAAGLAGPAAVAAIHDVAADELDTSPVWHRRNRPGRRKHGRAGRNGVRVDQPGAGVEHDHLVRLRQPSGLAQLTDGGDAGGALRADEAALQAGHRALVGEQRLVCHCYGGPAGGVESLEDEEVTKGVRHRDPERHRLGVRPWLARRGAGLERLYDRRAAGRLDRDQPRQVTGHPAELEQLAQGLVDADDAHAPAGGVHDHAGHPPAELLGDLQAHRLLALDPVRLLQRRDILIIPTPFDGPGD